MLNYVDGKKIPYGLYIGDVLSAKDEQASVLPVEDFNNLDLVLVLKRLTKEEGK